jgi:hypothetical protein
VIGTALQLPVNFSISTILHVGAQPTAASPSTGRVASTVMGWGAMLLRWSGKQRASTAANLQISHLGYSSVGHYFYGVQRGSTFGETLLAVAATAKKGGLPFAFPYMLIDSFWYGESYTAAPNNTAVAGCVCRIPTSPLRGNQSLSNRPPLSLATGLLDNRSPWQPLSLATVLLGNRSAILAVPLSVVYLPFAYLFWIQALAPPAQQPISNQHGRVQTACDWSAVWGWWRVVPERTSYSGTWKWDPTIATKPHMIPQGLGQLANQLGGVKFAMHMGEWTGSGAKFKPSGPPPWVLPPPAHVLLRCLFSFFFFLFSSSFFRV